MPCNISKFCVMVSSKQNTGVWLHICSQCRVSRRSDSSKYVKVCDAYRKLHGKRTKGNCSPEVRKAPSARVVGMPRMNCIRLGDLVRQVKRLGCHRTVGVYACSEFGEAIPFGVEIDGVKCCQRCPKYQG